MLTSPAWADTAFPEYALFSHLYPTISIDNSTAIDYSKKDNLAGWNYSSPSKYSEGKPFSYVNDNGETENWIFDKHSSRFKFYLYHNNESYSIRSWGMFDWLLAYVNDTVYDAKVVGNYLVYKTSYKVGCFNLKTKKECTKVIEDKSPDKIKKTGVYSTDFKTFLLPTDKSKNEIYTCETVYFTSKEKLVKGSNCVTLALTQYD